MEQPKKQSDEIRTESYSKEFLQIDPKNTMDFVDFVFFWVGKLYGGCIFFRTFLSKQKVGNLVVLESSHL